MHLGQRRSAAIARRLASGGADEYWQTVEAIKSSGATSFDPSLERPTVGRSTLFLVPLIRCRRCGTARPKSFSPYPGAYVPLANVSGFPAGTVPVARVRAGEESDRRAASRDQVDAAARETERGSAGLPIGVQMMARRPWQDHIALAAMGAIEAAARKRPDYPGAAAAMNDVKRRDPRCKPAKMRATLDAQRAAFVQARAPPRCWNGARIWGNSTRRSAMSSVLPRRSRPISAIARVTRPCSTKWSGAFGDPSYVPQSCTSG